MKLFLIALSMAFCSTMLQARVITCASGGIPVVQLKIENNNVVEAREILQSNLTGELSNSTNKLRRIPSNNKNISMFHLGSSYTVDYTLGINFENNPVTVSVRSLDRDDWTGSSTDLVCR